MKKSFIVVVFTVFCCMFLGTTCYAGTELYLTTDNCPEAYIEYAEEHALDFVSSMEEVEITDYKNISLGEPFNFGNQDADIYYFPVLDNGKMIYLFRVYPDGDSYSGAMSIFLVEELNMLASKTSKTQPLTLVMDNYDIVAYIGTEEYTLFSYSPDSASESKERSILMYEWSHSSSRNVVNILEESDLDLQQCAATLTTRAGSKYLALTIKGTQGNSSWCAAYVTDIILRYVGAVPSSHSHLTITDHFGLTLNDALSRTQVRTYANSKGVYPYYVTVNSVTRDKLVEEIDKGCPVYISMLDANSSTDVGHAVALRGYHLLAETYSIWNPWYNYYESYTMGGSYVPATDSSINYQMRGYMISWEY